MLHFQHREAVDYASLLQSKLSRPYHHSIMIKYGIKQFIGGDMWYTKCGWRAYHMLHNSPDILLAVNLQIQLVCLQQNFILALWAWLVTCLVRSRCCRSTSWAATTLQNLSKQAFNKSSSSRGWLLVAISCTVIPALQEVAANTTGGVAQTYFTDTCTAALSNMSSNSVSIRLWTS